MSKPPPAERGGLHAALRFTGIPPSWLEKKPKLPSRNWLIFISVVTSLSALYIDDRRKCRNIREEYMAKVRELADETLESSLDPVRKVTVYSCRYPEDHDHERSMKYFKKYVKPMFIAAALDYEIVNGNQYGALVHEVADSVKKKRRIAAGLEKPRDPLPMPLAPPQLLAKLRKDTEGGIVIVGRHTFKEYMEGLKRGWSESMSSVSVEEQVLSTLNDDVFDEIPIQQSDDPTSRPEPKVEALHLPTSIPKNTSSPLSSLHPFKQSSLSVQQPSPPLVIDAPPAFIPSSPPIGLVPFTNHLGFRQAPYMVYDFFTQRHRVLSGCKAGYAIVLAQTRPMTPYSRSDTPSDLNFDTESEQYIKSSFDKLPKRIADAKKEYYKGLQKRVKTARELAYGEREPTRAERANPPMTEVEIRAERLKKEVKWKEDLSGWEVLRNDVQWDDRFEGVLQVYIDPEPTL